MAEDTIKDEEYAPITQALRLYADTMLSEYSPILFHIKELCDNIDALHKALEEQNAKLHEKVLNQRKQLAEVQEAIERRNNGVLKRRWQKKMDALKKENERLRDFNHRVREAIRRHEDLTLWGADYMALPLDADGVPIHVGDVVKGEKVGGGFGEPFEVVGYIMSNGELEPMDEHGCPRKHEYLHHHHEPTVEDVLWEFTRAILNQKAEYREQNIAKYAAKLRLADDAE